MKIDWKNLPTLPSRRRQARDIDALARAKDKRRKRKGSKAHATAKDIAIAARRKAAKAKQRVADRDKAAREHKDAVRAFWRGEREEHP